MISAFKMTFRTFRVTLRMSFRMTFGMTLRMTFKTWDFRRVSKEDFEGDFEGFGLVQIRISLQLKFKSLELDF